MTESRDHQDSKSAPGLLGSNPEANLPPGGDGRPKRADLEPQQSFPGRADSHSDVQASSGARKDDPGKPRMDLLDPYALQQLASVLGYGATKYAPWNWTKGLAYSRLIGAAHRHLFAFQSGEDLDPESGLPHVAHAMCNLMFLLSMAVRHPELDDRNKLEQDDTAWVSLWRYKCKKCGRSMMCPASRRFDHDEFCSHCRLRMGHD